MQWGALLFALSYATAFALTGSTALGLTAVVILAFLAVALAAGRPLERGETQTAAAWVCAAILAASLALLPLQPGLHPTLAVTSLLAAALALPYVTQWVLRALMAASWISAVAAVTAGPLLWADGTGESSTLSFALGISTLAAAAAIAMLVLYQFRTHLAGALGEARWAEELARHEATHDSLTGLPNRTLMERRLSQRLSQNRTTPEYSPFAVLFLDLDHFKHVNDSLGHSVGDELLKIAARRLLSCVRPEQGDMVARLGGDEFVVMVAKAEVGVAEIVAARIQEALLKPVKLYAHELYASASVGLLPDCSGYETPEEVLRDADTAMFRAKESGRGRPAVFESSMRVRAISRLRLESDLRRAVEQGEFAICYEPVVWLTSGVVVGFWASVRWAHPERGLLSAGEFASVAEEAGLAPELDRLLLKEACRRAGLWRRRFPEKFPPMVCVELSASALSRGDLPGDVASALEDGDLAAGALMVSFAEEALAHSPEEAISTLEHLAALGTRPAVGGFGSGRSSLGFLHRLEADVLEIESSFTRGLGTSAGADQAEVARTILAVARGLGMEVMAEGVETIEQTRALQEMECDYARGPRFSQPVDAEGAEAILAGEPSW